MQQIVEEKLFLCSKIEQSLAEIVNSRQFVLEKKGKFLEKNLIVIVSNTTVGRCML